MNNAIFPNKFKAALAAQQVQIGCWSALASPITTEVLGLAGFDWLVLDAKAPMVMDRNFKPGFRIDLHIKDLANALDTSHGVGAQLPLTAAVMEMMQALRADGHGNDDHSALACYYEKLAKVEVTR
ncbi:hypothetical protein FLY10_05735 [Salmonella enterica]|nr:hypothetical protein [Salmonella enterica]